MNIDATGDLLLHLGESLIVAVLAHEGLRLLSCRVIIATVSTGVARSAASGERARGAG